MRHVCLGSVYGVAFIGGGVLYFIILSFYHFDSWFVTIVVCILGSWCVCLVL